MSFGVDANLLVYASVETSPFHERASAFLRRCAEGPEIACLPWPVVMAFLRLVTHPRIVSEPLTPEAAMANVDALLSLPHVRAIGEDDGFWKAYRSATTGLAVRGNLVADAHVAALLRQHGVRVLYSNDADYRRFAFLDVRNPLEGD